MNSLKLLCNFGAYLGIKCAPLRGLRVPLSSAPLSQGGGGLLEVPETVGRLASVVQIDISGSGPQDPVIPPRPSTHNRCPY